MAVMILTALIHLIAPYFAALIVLLIVALAMIDRGTGTKKPPE